VKRASREVLSGAPTPTPQVAIVDIASHLPNQVVTNAGLAAAHPAWDMDRVAKRAGILSRHIASPAETALDLGVAASRALIDRHPGLMDQIDGIIFCTQTPDYLLPPNACVLHRELGLRDEVLALDTSLACSGYVYSLALAEGLIVAGTCTNVLVVTADTYSRLINPGDRAARTLFGDGAAATWVRATTDDRSGLLDVLCATSGSGFEKFFVPAGGARIPRSADTARKKVDQSGNVRTDEDIHMDGLGVLSFVRAKVPTQVRTLLDRGGIAVADLDLVVFHQASKLALDALTRALKLPEDKVFRNMASIGNTVSASIPISLEQARAEGAIAPGSLVLLCGFGVGLSWASALVRF
jgi:3-oxoacyl-[acyl-carrier-protein] synthase-3